MARCTRSIALVLIGTGMALPACDDRQRHEPDPPPEPDGSFDPGPTTRPNTEGGPYGGGPGSAAPYRDGTVPPAGHSGAGWMRGPVFGGRRPGSLRGGNDGTAGSSEGGAYESPSEGHGRGGSGESGGTHASFGGFGGHASASHGGT